MVNVLFQHHLKIKIIKLKMHLIKIKNYFGKLIIILMMKLMDIQF